MIARQVRAKREASETVEEDTKKEASETVEEGNPLADNPLPGTDVE